jgi:hypothetical protein
MENNSKTWKCCICGDTVNRPEDIFIFNGVYPPTGETLQLCRKCIVGNGDGTYDASETPLGTQKPIGLIKKYNVFKADDNSAVDDCFVLRPDKDPTAAIALRAYADATENQELALDILRWLLDIKAKATAGD